MNEQELKRFNELTAQIRANKSAQHALSQRMAADRAVMQRLQVEESQAHEELQRIVWKHLELPDSAQS